MVFVGYLKYFVVFGVFGSFNKLTLPYLLHTPTSVSMVPDICPPFLPFHLSSLAVPPHYKLTYIVQTYPVASTFPPPLLSLYSPPSLSP